MLCRVCKTVPTCNSVDPEHEIVITVPMPYGYTFNLKGTHTAAIAVCPMCMPALAQREYEQIVRPVLTVGPMSAFEMACIATKLSGIMEAS